MSARRSNEYGIFLEGFLTEAAAIATIRLAGGPVVVPKHLVGSSHLVKSLVRVPGILILVRMTG